MHIILRQRTSKIHKPRREELPPHLNLAERPYPEITLLEPTSGIVVKASCRSTPFGTLCTSVRPPPILQTEYWPAFNFNIHCYSLYSSYHKRLLVGLIFLG